MYLHFHYGIASGVRFCTEKHIVDEIYIYIRIAVVPTD